MRVITVEVGDKGAETSQVLLGDGDNTNVVGVNGGVEASSRSCLPVTLERSL